MQSGRIVEAGKRDAVVLENESIRVVVDAEKGMIPELSARYKNGWINAHWQPWFRANSGLPWDDDQHSGFWKVPLLYDIAGNFPCFPNFGSDFEAEGYTMPPHGFTAYSRWVQDDASALAGPDGIGFISRLGRGAHPFSYLKRDILLNGHNVHYTSVDISNEGSEGEPFNYGWHNTVGAPFLESGCLIDNDAEAFAVPPEGGEFDPTGRLAFGAQCDSLEAVPARDGGTHDCRRVTGITGYTDFISGAVSVRSDLVWSSIVNPRLKLVYMSFSTGPSAVRENELSLFFHDLWMNYGGRNYEPWAAGDGHTDMTFCLGAENTTGYFANGLKESVRHPVLLGNPTCQVLPAGESRRLNYGTLFCSYDGDSLDKGVKAVEKEDNLLVLIGYDDRITKVKADWQFDCLK